MTIRGIQGVLGVTVVTLAVGTGQVALGEPEKAPAAPKATPAAAAPSKAPAASAPATSQDKMAAEVKVGDTLPALTFKNAEGKDVDLKSIYSQKPVVLTFYRGGWCPFCNGSLKSFQDKLGETEKLGATVVAVSPESPEQLTKTIEKGTLTYPVLSDSTGAGMHALGLAFGLDEPTKKKYQGYGVNLGKSNASGKWELPHPATLVVDTKGVVRYAYVNTDYTKRAKVEDVLAAVKKLQDEAKPAAGH